MTGFRRVSLHHQISGASQGPASGSWSGCVKVLTNWIPWSDDWGDPLKLVIITIKSKWKNDKQLFNWEYHFFSDGSVPYKRNEGMSLVMPSPKRVTIRYQASKNALLTEKLIILSLTDLHHKYTNYARGILTFASKGWRPLLLWQCTDFSETERE